MTTLRKAIESGLASVCSAQRLDGAFVNPKRPAATFMTSLVLLSLAEVDGARSTGTLGAAYLLRHRSLDWSWNYWQRGSKTAAQLPYPDDLDDTFCALAAIWHYQPEAIDGNALARVARHLIATEVQAGGPYRTWLVDETAGEKWRDVDLVVNANVGYFLSLTGVTLPPLEAYLSNAIASDKPLMSPYYVGEAPVIYLLARGYHGSAAERLRERAERLLGQTPSTDSLTTALLASALLRLNAPISALQPAIKRLLTRQRNGHWPATPFYVDPETGGAPQSAGSTALTTAVCVEALSCYERALDAHKRIAMPKATLRQDLVERSLEGTGLSADGLLTELYRDQLARILARDHDGQITAIASVTAKALGAAIDPTALLDLSVASLNGWAAYTIYDDLLDGEGSIRLLSVANVAMRRSVGVFRSILPHDRVFQNHVAAAFAAMDRANTWEQIHARATVEGDRITYSALPDYGDLSLLADRSWGHALAPEGVMRLAGRTDEASLADLQHFWRHFLIARQLNDDAHDWEEDLHHGQLTAVVTLILKASNMDSPGSISLATELETLRQRFWDETIESISELIQTHVDGARSSLHRTTIMTDPSIYEGWLIRIESAAQRAVTERRMVRDFISTFSD